MTHREMFSDARWLVPAEDLDAALFRSVFTAKAGEKTEITVCGLGYFILYINGKRVGSDEFVPANSDYHDRPGMTLAYPLNDEWNHRIYCMKYDISEYICDGENVIGVMVGGGFYHQTKRLAEGNMSYGKIKLCYKIDFNGRTVFSDKSVKYKTGFFKSSNLFHGEELDYTGFDRKWNTSEAENSGWKDVSLCAAPKSEYLIQTCPTDKVVETLKPELVKNFGDYSVYKIPKNITGYPVIRCKKAGETVVMECAEEIYEDGRLDNTSVGYGHQRQIEKIVTYSEEIYHPWFCWFGFQYFTLTNNAEPVEIRVIHADVAVTSDFRCSDETLNWFNRAFVNTQLSNMHGGIPSDCPHRERLGYTGDGQLTCDAVMTQFDAKEFYRKWILDICDCQDMHTGHVQHTAPFAGGGGGPAGWGGAMIVVPYQYYRHYGDREFIDEIYPHMQKYVEYMESRCEDGIVVREEKDGWCLGDWCPPQKVEIPEPFVNTTMYTTMLDMLSELSEPKEKEKYTALAEYHRSKIKEKYCENGSYLNGIQGADAFAMYCGLGDEKLLEKICDKYEKLSEFDTGIFGTPILLDILFRNGKGDLAAKLLANKNTVSFETMRRHGATTLWENWNAESSHSHPMFGASTVYLYNYVLGLRQKENTAGWTDVIVEPFFADCLDFAEGYITTPQGKISVSWKRENGSVTVNIELSKNINAVFKHKSYTEKLSFGTNTLTF